MFQLIIIGFYLSFVCLVLYGFHRLFGMGVSGGIVLGIALMLAPFWDGFVAKGIMINFNRQHSPLQKIIRTVENPGSVLWLDDVWPGFDEYGRHWMVESYLDGIHLTSLALNGDDGKIYMYQASVEDFLESERIRPEHERLEKNIAALRQRIKGILKKHEGNPSLKKDEMWKKYHQDTKQLWLKSKELESKIKKLGYKKIRKQEIDRIYAKPVVYDSPADLPPINYRVHFQRLRLPDWQEKFVWCDEIAVQDVHQNEEVAFSKRCLGYTLDAAKVVYYTGVGKFGGARLGDERAYSFDDKVVFEWAEVIDTLEVTKNNLDRSFYKLGQ
jgi:uncharacterized membrane protein (DUF485 family)